MKSKKSVRNGDSPHVTSTLGNIRQLGDDELTTVSGGKLLDQATPKLYEAACKGTHIPQVTIELW